MNEDLSKLSDEQLDSKIADALQTDMVSSWDPQLIRYLTTSLLIFGLLVLALMTYLVVQKKNTGQVLRLFTVPVVIVASVFLVLTGYSNEQITPVVGLLGTIVGYILGSHSTRSEPVAEGEVRHTETIEKGAGT